MNSEGRARLYFISLILDILSFTLTYYLNQTSFSFCIFASLAILILFLVKDLINYALTLVKHLSYSQCVLYEKECTSLGQDQSHQSGAALLGIPQRKDPCKEHMRT